MIHLYFLHDQALTIHLHLYNPDLDIQEYLLMNKILNGYNSYIPTDRRDKKKEFILQKWAEYSKFFKCDDKNIEKASTMFFLFCTLSDYVTVSKVLRGKDL